MGASDAGSGSSGTTFLPWSRQSGADGDFEHLLSGQRSGRLPVRSVPRRFACLACRGPVWPGRGAAKFGGDGPEDAGIGDPALDALTVAWQGSQPVAAAGVRWRRVWAGPRPKVRHGAAADVGWPDPVLHLSGHRGWSSASDRLFVVSMLDGLASARLRWQPFALRPIVWVLALATPALLTLTVPLHSASFCGSLECFPRRAARYARVRR